MRIYEKWVNADNQNVDADPIKTDGRYLLKDTGGEGVPVGNHDTAMYFRLLGEGTIGASIQSFQTAFEGGGAAADVAVGDVVSLTATDGDAYGAVDANIAVFGRLGFSLSNLSGTVHSFAARVVQ